MRSVFSLLLLSSCSASTCEQDASALLQSQRLVRKQSAQDANQLLAKVQNVAKSFTEGSEVSIDSDDVNTALGETSTALHTMLPMFAAQHAAAQQEINHALGAIEACQGQNGGEVGARLVLAATRALAEKEQCEESLQQAVHAEVEACEGQADDPNCLCTEARTAITQQGELCAAKIETYEVTFCEHELACNMLHTCHAQEVEVYNAVRIDVEAAMDARQQQYLAVRQAECLTDLITTAMLMGTPIPHASLVGCSDVSIDDLIIAFPQLPPAPTGCLEPQGGPQCDTGNVFFHNAVGAAHVIGDFWTEETATGEDGHFLQRMQCASNVVQARVQGGSCGDATVQFRINDRTANFFGSGVQSSWQAIAEVVVVSGDVANVPDKIWTGGGHNNGWILFRQGGTRQGGTFASSYSPNTGWDYCNGNALTGSETVSLQCVGS